MITLKIPNWLKIHKWNLWKSTSHVQLECQLSPLGKFLEDYLAPDPNPNPQNKVQIAKDARNLVVKARDKLAERSVQEAWTLYYAAELLQYKLMRDEEIEARAAKILFANISVLDDDAKKCVRRLLGKDAGNGDWKLEVPVGTEKGTEKVIEARRIVQDYYNNKYTNLGLALGQLGLLAFIAALLSLTVIFVVLGVPSNIFTFDHLSAANFTATNVTATNFNASNFVASNFTATGITASNVNQVSSANWHFWIAIGLFGAIGGAISGLYGLKQEYSSTSDIPERVLNNWITIAKPAVGFAAAIIIAVFLIGGLVQPANLKVSNYVIYAMAFISGFSERLIIGAVQERLPSSG